MAVLCLGFSGLAFGCGDDQSSEAPDAAPSVDAQDIDAQALGCTYNGFTATTQLAERDNELGVLFYTASSGQAPNIEVLTFDLYFSLGATDAVHDLTFSGQTLEDCDTCLLMRRDCSEGNCSSGKAFLVQEGSASVTAIGEAGSKLQGSFKNLKLAEATIGITGKSTLVPGGEQWCLDDFSFDQNISAQ